MTRAGLLAALLLACLLLVGCWGKDNPLDPGRCDPPCGVGSRCVSGQCVQPDLGATDMHMHMDRAAADHRPPRDLKQKPKPDRPWPDQQAPPDQSGVGTGCAGGTATQVFTKGMVGCAGNKDPLGNTCNWTGCGYLKAWPKQHFGGCKNNSTAGAICCPK